MYFMPAMPIRPCFIKFIPFYYLILLNHYPLSKSKKVHSLHFLIGGSLHCWSTQGTLSTPAHCHFFLLFNSDLASVPPVLQDLLQPRSTRTSRLLALEGYVLILIPPGRIQQPSRPLFEWWSFHYVFLFPNLILYSLERLIQKYLPSNKCLHHSTLMKMKHAVINLDSSQFLPILQTLAFHSQVLQFKPLMISR